MSFEQFRNQAIKPILEAVHTLTLDDQTPKQEKLDKATDLFGQAGEYSDTALASLLPGPIGGVAAWIVDMPPVDAWQREYLWKPLTELAYQGIRFYQGLLEGANEFIKKVVSPVLELIPTLTNPLMTGAAKHARVKLLILQAFGGLGEGLVELLPQGLKPFALFALQTPQVAQFIEWLAGFIAEALYAVWRVLSGDEALAAKVVPAAV